MEFVDTPLISWSRSNPTTQMEWAALPTPLRECGEIAGQRLANVLSDALRQAMEQLFSESLHALTQAEREAILDAAEFARARKDSLITDFIACFEKQYVRACHYKPRLLTSFRIDFDASQLKIVEHDLLDESLDPGLIAEAIQNASWHTLNSVTRCYGKLLGDESIKPNDIPVSPKLIEAAVSEAILAQPWRHDAKSRLIRSLRRFLPHRVGLLYRDLTEHLYPKARQVEDQPLDIQLVDIQPVDALQVDVTPALQDQREQKVVAPSLVQDVEKNNEAIDVAPPDAAIEQALATVRDEVARRQATSSYRLPPSQSKRSVGQVFAPAALPDTVASPATSPSPKIEVQATVPTNPQTNPSSRQTQIAGALAELESGSWLEFLQPDGSWKELKLAWISPRKSLYLMTNREGERALSMVAEDLTVALRDGHARIVMPRETRSSASVGCGQHTKKTA